MEISQWPGAKKTMLKFKVKISPRHLQLGAVVLMPGVHQVKLMKKNPKFLPLKNRKL